MKNKIIYLVLISFIVIGSLSNTEAQRRFLRGENLPPNHPRLILMDELNLTDAQKNKIDDIRFNHQKEMIELRSILEQKKLELRKYRSSDEISRSKVISLTKEVNEIRNKISLARANHQMDIFEVLDSNQQKIWHDYRPLGFSKKERGMFRNWPYCW
jgi:Spy/CpxP family protein refolding chaperone